MADPVAVITYTDTPIAATSLPTSVVMSGTTSTFGDGASIVGYQWHLLAKPPGSAANLTDATSSVCTLNDIDLPGTYYVFLVVENDLGDFSFNQPTPKQLGIAPYTFTAPPATALRTVTVLTENAGLIKVAPGERDWLARGLWPLVDEVDALRGEHDDLQTAFDAHAIADHDTTATGAQLNTLTSSSSSDASALHTHTSIPATTIGTLEVTTALNTDSVTSRTSGGSVAVRGTAGHTADLATDIIQADTTNSAVTIKKKGTFPVDLIAERAQLDLINGVDPRKYEIPLFNKFVNTATTGTSEEKVFEANAIAAPLLVPDLNGGRFLVETLLQFAANGNTKTWKVKVDDGINPPVTVASVSSLANGLTAMARLSIFVDGEVLGDSVLRVLLETSSSFPATTVAYDPTAYSADITGSWAVSLWLETPDSAGDLTCIWGSVVYEPPVIP